MEIRNIKLEDLDNVFELLNELYENKIEYSKFTKKYKESLKDSNFYGIVAIKEYKVVGVLISQVINRLAKIKLLLLMQ